MKSESLTEPLRETLATFERAGEPRTTPEVADRLDLGRRSTYARLERLVDADLLETKKVGANARVWWRSLSHSGPLAGDGRFRDAGVDRSDGGVDGSDGSDDGSDGGVDRSDGGVDGSDGGDDGSNANTGLTRQDHASRDLDHEFERLIDAVDEYAIYTLDADGFVRSWNPGVERIKGYTRDEIVGEHVSTFYTEEDRAAGVPQRNLDDADQRGSAEDEGWRVRADGSLFWATVTVSAIRDEDGSLVGYAKVTRDMTERREYERTLEAQARRLEHQVDDLESELDEVFSRISDGFYALDEDLRFLYLNDHATEILGLDESALGRKFLDLVTVTDTFERALHEAVDSGEPVIFEDYYDPVDRWYYNAIYPSESGLSVYFRDVTERKRRAKELERFEVIVEKIRDVTTILDPTGTIQYVSPSVETEIGHDPSDLIGESPFEYVHPDDRDRLIETFVELVDDPAREPTVEYRFQREDGSYAVLESRARNLLDDPNIDGVVVYSRDVTERRERQRQLRESEQRYRKLVENIPDAAIVLFDDDFRFTTAGGELLDQIDVTPDELAGQTIYERYPDDLVDAIEPHFLATLDGEQRSVTVENHGRELAMRILPVGDDEEFTGMLMVQDVTEQNAHERKLNRQREQLSALNDINEVVSEITTAVIDQSTREEIEQTVCEGLAGADAYEFAWLAAVDSTTNTFVPRAEAGTRGYTDAVTISIDPKDPDSDGPGATAIREQETQVVQDVFADPRFEPWREVAAEYGFNAVASIPITHDRTVYGVLGIYADRQNAFDDAERTIVSRLGEVVGHAISATERKRALMSDELVELEFLIQDGLSEIDDSIEMEGSIVLEETVHVGDDEFLVYATATGGALDTASALVDALAHWDEVTVVSAGDPAKIELRLDDPPVLSVVTALGGYVDDVVIADGDYRMTVHLAPTAEVRHVIDAMETAYPSAEMVRRKQISRSSDDPHRVRRQYMEGLTERQRAALDAAYHAGYFDWPRETSGESLAESLDVSPPTYHQHLRMAEGKVLDALYLTESHGE